MGRKGGFWDNDQFEGKRQMKRHSDSTGHLAGLSKPGKKVEATLSPLEISQFPFLLFLMRTQKSEGVL
jgi:hypothetical protein